MGWYWERDYDLDRLELEKEPPGNALMHRITRTKVGQGILKVVWRAAYKTWNWLEYYRNPNY